MHPLLPREAVASRQGQSEEEAWRNHTTADAHDIQVKKSMQTIQYFPESRVFCKFTGQAARRNELGRNAVSGKAT
jgi:hypothetical protein